jgi:hypothetical protein
MSKPYNGWTNYETWNYKLWLDNDKELNNSVFELVQTHKDTYDLSQELRKLAYDNAPTLVPSFYSDVMYGSMREVNFREIAESYLEEIKAE